MPKKDGREALAEIKADAALRQIPVVVLTTSKDEQDVSTQLRPRRQLVHHQAGDVRRAGRRDADMDALLVRDRTTAAEATMIALGDEGASATTIANRENTSSPPPPHFVLPGRTAHRVNMPAGRPSRSGAGSGPRPAVRHEHNPFRQGSGPFRSGGAGSPAARAREGRVEYDERGRAGMKAGPLIAALMRGCGLRGGSGGGKTWRPEDLDPVFGSRCDHGFHVGWSFGEAGERAPGQGSRVRARTPRSQLAR